MILRRTIQLTCLALFMGALGAAVFSWSWFLPADLFLRLDPVLVGGTILSARQVTAAALPALAVLLSALFLGRAFCGYVCPLGTTLDGPDRLRAKTPRPGGLARLRPVKYWLLLFILGGALAGISLVFLASPLSLVTRFYGLVVYPVLAFLAEAGLGLAQPLIEGLDIDALLFVQVRTPRFATQLFVLVFFAALFAAAFLSPRFWCRYLCPGGALLGLLSRKPLVRRRVSKECIDCGKCRQACPMDAIPENPLATRHQECLVCRTCREVCPVAAVSFAPEKKKKGFALPGVSLERRGFLLAGMGGLALGLTGRTGLHAALAPEGPGRVNPPGLIRPPAALPEGLFLAQCVRCGECVAACPTNTLQPLWLQAGFFGLFSPAQNLRRGPCDPRCRVCAQVCPTGAVRLVETAQRVWAKTGTAVIDRQRCLAWEQDRKCLVCDEVCPFNAVEFRREEGLSVTVPHVIEDRCAGCGFCEHHCPVQNRAAITVTAQGALRLKAGSFEEEARSRGLSLSLREESGPASPGPGNPGGYPQNKAGGSGFTD